MGIGVNSEQLELLREAVTAPDGQIMARITGRPSSVEADAERCESLVQLADMGLLEDRPQQGGFAIWRTTLAGLNVVEQVGLAAA